MRSGLTEVPDVVIAAADKDLNPPIGCAPCRRIPSHGQQSARERPVRAKAFPLRPISIRGGLPEVPDVVIAAADKDLNPPMVGGAWRRVRRHSQEAAGAR